MGHPALCCIQATRVRNIYEPVVLFIVRSFFYPKEFSAIICFAAEWGKGRAMRPRRFAIIAAGLCGTVILVGCVIAAVSGWGLADIKNTHAQSIEDRATEMGNTGPEAVSAAAPMTAIAETAIAENSLREPSQPEATFAEVAAASTSDYVHTGAKEAVSSAETRDESLPNPSQTFAPETRPVQIAAVSADDVVHGDFNGVVSAESLPDSSHALALETPADGKEAVTSKSLDECLTREICIDEYLWSVYQRAPKQDAIKVVERRNVTVKMDGKPRTVVKEFTTLVDEDFTWKDPKAAEKAGMSLMEYVIGGMDRDFKLKLYHALRAMDDAGLSPGITSAFRDDYRQSLASGLKAATNRSYHGGSLRGGYGHGLAADLVSVKGETRAERLIASESLWKWIDAHGKEFGIGRPYLDKDPAHVAPIDGKEYADHRRGTNTQHARAEIKKHNLLAVRDDHNVTKPARTARTPKVLRSI